MGGAKQNRYFLISQNTLSFIYKITLLGSITATNLLANWNVPPCDNDTNCNINTSDKIDDLINDDIGDNNTLKFQQATIDKIINYGNIYNSKGYGIYITSGSINKIINEGKINGDIIGIYDGGGFIGSIENSGEISGGSIGISIYSLNRQKMESIINNGKISGDKTGIELTNGIRFGTIENGGEISGGRDNGIMLYHASADSVINKSGGKIYGKERGIYIDGGNIQSIENSGEISGNWGIYVDNYAEVASIINKSGGFINGSRDSGILIGANITIKEIINEKNAIISGQKYGIYNDSYNTKIESIINRGEIIFKNYNGASIYNKDGSSSINIKEWQIKLDKKASEFNKLLNVSDLINGNANHLDRIIVGGSVDKITFEKKSIGISIGNEFEIGKDYDLGYIVLKNNNGTTSQAMVNGGSGIKSENFFDANPNDEVDLIFSDKNTAHLNSVIQKAQVNTSKSIAPNFNKNTIDKSVRRNIFLQNVIQNFVMQKAKNENLDYSIQDYNRYQQAQVIQQETDFKANQEKIEMELNAQKEKIWQDSKLKENEFLNTIKTIKRNISVLKTKEKDLNKAKEKLNKQETTIKQNIKKIQQDTEIQAKQLHIEYEDRKNVFLNLITFGKYNKNIEEELQERLAKNNKNMQYTKNEQSKNTQEKQKLELELIEIRENINAEETKLAQINDELKSLQNHRTKTIKDIESKMSKITNSAQYKPNIVITKRIIQNQEPHTKEYYTFALPYYNHTSGELSADSAGLLAGLNRDFGEIGNFGFHLGYEYSKTRAAYSQNYNDNIVYFGLSYFKEFYLNDIYNAYFKTFLLGSYINSEIKRDRESANNHIFSYGLNAAFGMSVKLATNHFLIGEAGLGFERYEIGGYKLGIAKYQQSNANLAQANLLVGYKAKINNLITAQLNVGTNANLTRDYQAKVNILGDTYNLKDKFIGIYGYGDFALAFDIKKNMDISLHYNMLGANNLLSHTGYIKLGWGF